jgi:hypothetical protein
MSLFSESDLRLRICGPLSRHQQPSFQIRRQIHYPPTETYLPLHRRPFSSHGVPGFSFAEKALRSARSATPFASRSSANSTGLENNPDVMNSLVHSLGLSKALAFQDVFSITEPALLAFVPRPAHALLLIFPVSEVYEKARLEEDKSKQDYSGSGPDEPVIWYKQTIGNACGLIGLLHAVSNGEAATQIGTLARLSWEQV